MNQQNIRIKTSEQTGDRMPSMEVFKQIPEDLDSFEGDLLIAVVGEDERPLRAANAWLDWRLYGTITDLLVKNLFHGSLSEKCLIPTYGRFQFDRVVLVGGGKLFQSVSSPVEEEGYRQWMSIAETIERTLQPLKVQRVGLSLPRFQLAEEERALMKALQASHLPENAALFLPRSVTNSLAQMV